MRSLIVTASLASLLLSAPGASAAEPLSGGGTRKLSQSETKPAAAAAGVPATEIKSNLAHTPETARTAGFKSTGGGPSFTRTAPQPAQKRLNSITRVIPVRSTKGLTAGAARTVSSADVPVTIVTRALTAAPRTPSTKRLVAPAGPSLQGSGSKLSSMGNLKGKSQ